MKRSPWQIITQAWRRPRPKRYLVQCKERGMFEDVQDFATKREARRFVRSREWGEDPGGFRIVNSRRQRR